MKNKKNRNVRKFWFRCVKGFLKIFIRKPKFVYLGDRIENKSIIISNHVGSSAPLSWEIYFDRPFRFWGTYEMNSGLKSVYRYLSDIYYYQKKHWNHTCARLFSIIAAPLANMFYKGMNLISTYKDIRFKTTISKSLQALENNQNLIIFPEDSSNGYHDTLINFSAGFVMFGEICLKKGMDLPVYFAYLQKKNGKKFIIDKPIMFSELMGMHKDKQAVADYVCERINALQYYDADKKDNA